MVRLCIFDIGAIMTNVRFNELLSLQDVGSTDLTGGEMQTAC